MSVAKECLVLYIAPTDRPSGKLTATGVEFEDELVETPAPAFFFPSNSNAGETGVVTPPFFGIGGRGPIGGGPGSSVSVREGLDIDPWKDVRGFGFMVDVLGRRALGVEVGKLSGAQDMGLLEGGKSILALAVCGRGLSGFISLDVLE